MTEFERGVRFVMESEEHYGAPLRLFGNFGMSMRRRTPESLTPGSAAHRERRIQAVLACSKLPGKQEEATFTDLTGRNWY